MQINALPAFDRGGRPVPDRGSPVVQPVGLGDGLPLLHGLPRPQRLELVSSTAWADGPITQTYVAR